MSEDEFRRRREAFLDAAAIAALPHTLREYEYRDAFGRACVIAENLWRERCKQDAQIDPSRVSLPPRTHRYQVGQVIEVDVITSCIANVEPRWRQGRVFAHLPEKSHERLGLAYKVVLDVQDKPTATWGTHESLIRLPGVE